MPQSEAEAVGATLSRIKGVGMRCKGALFAVCATLIGACANAATNHYVFDGNDPEFVCEVNPSECPRGCSQRKYNGHSYLICHARLAWEDARDECLRIDWDLVRYDSAEEGDWLDGEIRSLFGDDEGPPWIGGQDREDEGLWRWGDGNFFWDGGEGGSAIARLYTNWAGGQPDDDGEDEDEGEDCAVVDVERGWIDIECEREQSFVCESSGPIRVP